MKSLAFFVPFAYLITNKEIDDGFELMRKGDDGKENCQSVMTRTMRNVEVVACVSYS